MSTLPVEIELEPPATAETLVEEATEPENQGLLFGVLFRDHAVKNATLHVWSRKILGSIESTVENSGKAPLLRSHFSRYFVNADGHDLLDAKSQIGRVGRG